MSDNVFYENYGRAPPLIDQFCDEIEILAKSESTDRIKSRLQSIEASTPVTHSMMVNEFKRRGVEF